MKLTNEIAGEILVERDPLRSSVEMHVMATVGGDHRVIRLSCHEARRLAALILFQAGRLERVKGSREFGRAEVESKSA